MSDDPYALHADGTAVDPAAFREAALADVSLAEDLKKDERASRVLASGDDAALQELLKEVHQVRLLFVLLVKGKGGEWERRRKAVAVKEREGREKSNCSCLFFSFVVLCSSTSSTDERMNKQTGGVPPRREGVPGDVRAHDRRAARVRARAEVGREKSGRK